MTQQPNPTPDPNDQRPPLPEGAYWAEIDPSPASYREVSDADFQARQMVLRAELAARDRYIRADWKIAEEAKELGQAFGTPWAIVRETLERARAQLLGQLDWIDLRLQDLRSFERNDRKVDVP